MEMNLSKKANMDVVTINIKRGRGRPRKLVDPNAPVKIKRARGGVIKYATDEERQQAKAQQQNNYSKKKCLCETCNNTFTRGNQRNHLRSTKHNIAVPKKIEIEC
jgi:hypothetical protein